MTVERNPKAAELDDVAAANDLSDTEFARLVNDEEMPF